MPGEQLLVAPRRLLAAPGGTEGRGRPERAGPVSAGAPGAGKAERGPLRLRPPLRASSGGRRRGRLVDVRGRGVPAAVAPPGPSRAAAAPAGGRERRGRGGPCAASAGAAEVSERGPAARSGPGPAGLRRRRVAPFAFPGAAARRSRSAKAVGEGAEGALLCAPPGEAAARGSDTAPRRFAQLVRGAYA